VGEKNSRYYAKRTFVRRRKFAEVYTCTGGTTRRTIDIFYGFPSDIRDSAAVCSCVPIITTMLFVIKSYRRCGRAISLVF